MAKTIEDEEIFPGQKDGISAMSGDNYVSTYEPVFEDEEVLFSFEDKDFSVMVDFYGEEEWRIQGIAVWNKEKKEWNEVLINLGMQKRLTKFMDREIDSYGNNLFETAYTAKYEPTDWKDCYD